jgi:hypothetical protein
MRWFRILGMEEEELVEDDAMEERAIAWEVVVVRAEEDKRGEARGNGRRGD